MSSSASSPHGRHSSLGPGIISGVHECRSSHLFLDNKTTHRLLLSPLPLGSCIPFAQVTEHSPCPTHVTNSLTARSLRRKALIRNSTISKSTIKAIRLKHKGRTQGLRSTLGSLARSHTVRRRDHTSSHTASTAHQLTAASTTDNSILHTTKIRA